MGLGLNLAFTACSLCEHERFTWLPFAEPTSGQAVITTPCLVAGGQTESRDEDMLCHHGSWVIELGFKGSCVSACFLQGERFCRGRWVRAEG